MKKRINIFWFRRDLRLKDNRALYEALNSPLPVLTFFLFDKSILEKLLDDDHRVLFIHDAIKEIKGKLQDFNSDILVKHDSVNNAWTELSSEYEIDTVYTNEDYEPYAIKRDKSVKNLLNKKKIKFQAFQDHCIFAKDQIQKSDGTPYTVYTPYKNKWLSTLTPKDIASYKSENKLKNLIKGVKFKMPTINDLGFKSADSKFPQKIIKRKKIKEYDLYRDIPSIDATSHLGIHLRFGTLSTRVAVQIAYTTNQTWLSQLIWREFFIQILYNFPHVQNKPFRKKYSKIKWRNNKADFEKWKNGTTGFPIVDAGMRELSQTGHMHNRVRMICASFLVKDLLIDWRWGEKYFASKLLDFELASNNGNWQWVAGTGCDAAPYFRIFNPHTQQKKFDPDFLYIKKWITEYESDDYPAEMIDHKEAYHRAQLTYQTGIEEAINE